MSASFTVRQEPDTLARRKIMAVTVTACVVFGGAVAVSGWLLADEQRGRDTGPEAAETAPTTIGILEQRLVLGPARGLEMQREQRGAIARWGWVDRDAGIARIPIERAMDLVAADAAAAAATAADAPDNADDDEGGTSP